MRFFAFFLLLSCFLLAGYGILEWFRLQLRSVLNLTLSLLLGIALASFLPFLLQLFYIPITGPTVFGSLGLSAVLVNIPGLIRVRKEGNGLRTYFRALAPGPLRVRPYEIPYWILLGFLIFVSAWRCYYLPPTSRDALSGPEAIAEFAVREHTMINSFFKIDLWSTNNQFKSPFLISLQVIYKLAGFPFGQVWLSIIFISLTIFLYQALKEKLHPILAATLLLLFTMTPEPYAYTFMILYDYSNMVYFFLGLYFLFRWFGAGKSTGTFYFAGFLLGIATYIRSETLALALLFLPPILLSQWRESLPLKKIIVMEVFFFLPSVVAYYLTVQLYLNQYLPVHYAVGSLINPHPVLSGLFQRCADIFTHLLTGQLGVVLWGYFFYLTAIFFISEALFFRRFNRDARNWLYAIAAVYLGLGILGWLLPVMDLTDSTKRGLFKLLPLALFYLANNALLLRISAAIARWEEAKPGARAASRAVLTKTGKAAVVQTGSRGRGTSPARTVAKSNRRKK